MYHLNQVLAFGIEIKYHWNKISCPSSVNWRASLHEIYILCSWVFRKNLYGSCIDIS